MPSQSVPPLSLQPVPEGANVGTQALFAQAIVAHAVALGVQSTVAVHAAEPPMPVVPLVLDVVVPPAPPVPLPKSKLPRMLVQELAASVLASTATLV